MIVYVCVHGMFNFYMHKIILVLNHFGHETCYCVPIIQIYGMSDSVTFSKDKGVLTGLQRECVLVFSVNNDNLFLSCFIYFFPLNFRNCAFLLSFL